MKPVPASLHVVIQVAAAVVVATLVVAAVVLLKTAWAQKAVATLDAVHVPPTLVNPGKTRVMVAMHKDPANRAEIVVLRPLAHRATKCNAKTHAALVSTWGMTNTMILTNVSLRAMCLQGFLHPVCQREVVVADEAATEVVVAVAETSAVVDRARAEAVAEETQVVGSGADVFKRHFKI